MNALIAFEIRWEAGDGDVELVGPGVKPMRFPTIRAAYEHYKRCFAPLSAAPLTVRAALPFEVKWRSDLDEYQFALVKEL